jgi:hypothetical protein
MVNDKFPEPGGYGFEMVDTPEFLPTRINGKFTANQILGIFYKFSAI